MIQPTMSAVLELKKPAAALGLGRPLTLASLCRQGSCTRPSRLCCFAFVVGDSLICGFVGYVEESGFLPHSLKTGLWSSLESHLEVHADGTIPASVVVLDAEPHSLVGSQPPHTYSVCQSETSGRCLTTLVASCPEHWKAISCLSPSPWGLCF